MSDTHFEPVYIGLGGTPGPILAADVGSKAAELARLASLRPSCPSGLRAADEPLRRRGCG